MPDFLARQERFPSVGSTNDVVRDWLAAGTPEVALAIADEQTAGRGRDGRRWVAPQGAALLLSLGFRYYNGNEGVPQDFAEAFRWFSLAAEHDMPQAQYLVGLLYSTGRGVEQNYATAFQFMWESAQAGFAGAVYAVGVAYGFGQGVERDLVQSYRWIYAAWRLTAQPPGAPIYQAAYDAAMLLTPAERTQAEAEALAWIAEHGLQLRGPQ